MNNADIHQRLVLMSTMGCDIEDAISRLYGDREAYLEFVGEYLRNIPLDALKKYIADGDEDNAFRCSHTIKGTCANLGLTPLYIPASEISENYRIGNVRDVTELVDLLYVKVSDILRVLEE